eukprot:jgi/Picre1/32078/NNA_007426.t1
MTLRIVSPHLPALSMVDMPGITKVAIDGQPKSIVQELESMARDYVKHENVIILAVTPANADLATSDALRLAREVDPTGERQRDIDSKMDMNRARAKEMEFFKGKDEYRSMENVGTDYLSCDLSEKLIASVRRQLPNISGFLNKSIMDLTKSWKVLVDLQPLAEVRWFMQF